MQKKQSAILIHGAKNLPKLLPGYHHAGLPVRRKHFKISEALGNQFGDLANSKLWLIRDIDMQSVVDMTTPVCLSYADLDRLAQ